MTPLRRLRVGIVGAGYIANVHSAAWRAVAGTFPASGTTIELAAASDLDVDRAAALANAWSWGHAVTDWSLITRSEDIDVVDVCVPNDLHAAVSIDALEHGKHVVCEKPLANDPSTARQMVDAAASSGRLAQVCFYYRLWPAVASARELIAAGEIGEVQHFRGWMLQEYAADEASSMGWRGDPLRGGPGALADLGSHILDIAISAVGDIHAVSAMTRSMVSRGVHQSDTDDLASVLVRFRNGASGVIEASWAARGHACDLGFDVIGSTGAIRFGWEAANQLEFASGGPHSRGSVSRTLLGPGMGDAAAFVAVAGQGLGYRDAFTIGLGRLVGAIAGRVDMVEPSFSDGLQVAEAVAAVQRSAVSGDWVMLPTAPREAVRGKSSRGPGGTCDLIT